MSRRPAQNGANTELVAAKDAEIARLKEVVGRLERRGDLLDARLLSFRAAEAEYRAQVASTAKRSKCRPAGQKVTGSVSGLW